MWFEGPSDFEVNAKSAHGCCVVAELGDEAEEDGGDKDCAAWSSKLSGNDNDAFRSAPDC